MSDFPDAVFEFVWAKLEFERNQESAMPERGNDGRLRVAMEEARKKMMLEFRRASPGGGPCCN